MSLPLPVLLVALLLATSVHAETPALASPPASSVQDTWRAMDQALAMVAHVRKELRLAREDGRTATASCLSEVLTRMDTAIRYQREHTQAAAKAKAEGDDDTARSQLYAARLRINAVRRAATDGGLCGVPTFVVDGSTTVVVRIDPDVDRAGRAALP